MEKVMTSNFGLKQNTKVLYQSEEFKQMQEYNIKLDIELIQFKVAHAQEKEQKTELEEQIRVVIEASLKEKAVVKE